MTTKSRKAKFSLVAARGECPFCDDMMIFDPCGRDGSKIKLNGFAAFGKCRGCKRVYDINTGDLVAHVNITMDDVAKEAKDLPPEEDYMIMDVKRIESCGKKRMIVVIVNDGTEDGIPIHVDLHGAQGLFFDKGNLIIDY